MLGFRYTECEQFRGARSPAVAQGISSSLHVAEHTRSLPCANILAAPGTSRQADVFTSAENLFDFFVAQSSQRMEPSQITGFARVEQMKPCERQAWKTAGAADSANSTCPSAREPGPKNQLG
jgi:hypothetical protein